jgi:hypothetical protein
MYAVSMTTIKYIVNVTHSLMTDGQKNKYSVLNECNRMLKYKVFLIITLFLIYVLHLQ